MRNNLFALAGMVLLLSALCSAKDKDVFSAKVDLNGDGKIDIISISPKKHVRFAQYTLTVNGTTVPCMLSETVDGIRIIDIDKKDKYKEIEAYTYGPSDDFASRLFRWDGKRLIDMGDIPGWAKLLGSGRIAVQYWVGFAYKNEVYGVDAKTVKLRLIEAADLLEMGSKTTTSAKLTLYTSPKCVTPIAEVASGKPVTLVAGKELPSKTPRKDYGDGYSILVKTKSGLLGWAPMVKVMKNVKSFPCAD